MEDAYFDWKKSFMEELRNCEVKDEEEENKKR